MNNKIFNTLYKEAETAFNEDEIPVSALIVKNNNIILSSHNEKEKLNCCTKHAEIRCLEKLSEITDDWRLNDYDIYISMEPCLMCLGALEQSRIKNIYYIVNNDKFGCLGNNKINLGNINVNIIKIDNNEYEEKFKKLLKDFFNKKR